MTDLPFIDPARPWTVVTGDCMAVFKDMPDGAVDVVIADPPYNERTHSGMMSAKNSKSTHRSTGPANRPHMVRLDFAPLEGVGPGGRVAPPRPRAAVLR